MRGKYQEDVMNNLNPIIRGGAKFDNFKFSSMDNIMFGKLWKIGNL